MDVPNVTRTEYQLVNIEDVGSKVSDSMMMTNHTGFPQLDGH
jgi:hypothetical protein